MTALPESLCRVLIEQGDTLVWSHDADGTLRFANEAAEASLGFEAGMLVGRNLREFLVQEPLEPIATHAAAPGQPGQRIVLRLRARSGETRFWSVRILRWKEEGRAGSLLGQGFDITAWIEAEAQLERSRDEALEAARLKSEFVASVSHEIRTPMNGVLGMADLLLDTALTPDQREYAETMRSSADALLTVVNDILDFSKIEAGALAFEMIDFALRPLVESTVELFAEAAKRKRIQLATLVFSDVPDTLRGDPSRLRQVITNLVGNAVKFTHSGEVTVRVTKEAETAAGVVIAFAIVDTGIGIAADVLPRLFQPFVQADGSTSRRYGGTGLGLAISRRLVEGMTGELTVQSEPGSGSTFRFTIPFAKQAAVRVPTTAPRVPLAGRRILVVDDHATNRLVLSHYVEACGMTPEEAAGAEDALERLRAAAARGAPFDAAILDLMMPGMTGFELARVIKSDPALADTRLILMPSFGRRGHATESREAGIAAYLVKPVRQSELEACLGAVFSGATHPDDQPELVTRHSLAEATGRAGPRILIAEDNPVNQKVLIAQVSSLGYGADIVSDGAAALEALESSRYALVLMDVMMPSMDGHAATRELRNREAGRQHLPVIAVTAGASPGDRERCMAAGMDDYLTKPTHKAELAAMLARWLAAELPDEPVQRAVPVPANRLQELREECGDACVASMIADFQEDALQRIERMRAALRARDPAALELEAHALKGSALHLGGERLAEACMMLEDQAEARELHGAPALIDRVETELEVFRADLRAGLPAWRTSDQVPASGSGAGARPGA